MSILKNNTNETSKITTTHAATRDAFSLIQAAEHLLDCKAVITARDYRALHAIFERISRRIPYALARHRFAAGYCRMLDRADVIEAVRK